MNKLIPPIIMGVISAFIAYFSWDSPSGWSPYGFICCAIIGLLAMAGALAGAVIGAISNAIFSRFGISDKIIMLLSSVLTAVFIGITAIILY